MKRAALFFSLALLLASRAFASDPIHIPTPKIGVSASVKQPHVTAELISEAPDFTTAGPFFVALHLHMDPGWHTYWVNPGDAGLATAIKWKLPPGFMAGPIQWPTPEVHKMGPLTTYGYAGDVYLLTAITPPKPVRIFKIEAEASWLVCQEECIPGKADLKVEFKDIPWIGPPSGVGFMEEAKKRLPIPNTRWNVEAYTQAAMKGTVTLHGMEKPGAPSTGIPTDLRFFPEQQNVLGNGDTDNPPPVPGNKSKVDGKPTDFLLRIAEQQNGAKPDKLSGVLTFTDSTGARQGLYVSPMQVIDFIETAKKGIPFGGTALTPTPVASSPAPVPAPISPAQPAPSASAEAPYLPTILGFAFLGGLILNLMPCVLPVLSLKVFSLIRHAGQGGAWKQGVAFTFGVVLSFWILAGLLIALRAAGNHLGWGFQMQSPGFVLALTYLFFVLALNLFGVFELGTSLQGLDAKTTSGISSGLGSSFLNGALATLAATPCTAPFMGSAVGFASEQPASISLLIFTVLALGMAAPYLLLTLFPGALQFVPKPGPWMEALKQFMGFLLMGTVIFLVYVFGALVGQDLVPFLLGTLLLLGLATWIYGRWFAPFKPIPVKVIAFVWILAIGLVVARESAFLVTQIPISQIPITRLATAANADSTQSTWQPWTDAAVASARSQGRPVFVDFTAAWCLSCKVNEAVALDTSTVQDAFKKKNVALFRADWTHSDPAITAILGKYHRDGVPLYLLYRPGTDDPDILPAVLTPGTLLDALNQVK